ncbi:MAG: cation:proton antiporter [Rhodoferax sp.]|uniref:cation:proton antiporter domain-containing protein n=1 Tax=Rhodoferax sp. TaxID=50421 RepID=UPI002628A49F|nr:cation:proton antiporter [Rhodoferax sp.]MDD2882483.1 cation:proton antiporter [Rhodoferax sp.]
MITSYQEFALLLMLSAVVGAIAVRLRQPLLMAYIIVGILVGPSVFGWVGAHDQIDLLAQIGITVLLFVVGLKLDLRHVRQIGPVALATGLGQLGFTILFGFFIILALGRGWLDALYVAVALTFSSTIIIVKLLSDKRELESLHGRIAVGFLIVQDLAVVIAMMVMSGLGGIGGEAVSGLTLTLNLLARLGGAAILLFILMRFVLPRVVDTLVFGLGRYGARLAQKLRERGMRVLGVDFDPEVIKALQLTGLDARFGDCEASDFVESLPLAGVPWVVSSLPGTAANHALLHALSEHHFSGRIAMVARHEAEAQALNGLPNVEVILPINQAADFAALDIAARIAIAETAEVTKDKESS